MLRGLLHPSEYKEILFQVSEEPKVTYGAEKSTASIARDNQMSRMSELKQKIKAKKTSVKSLKSTSDNSIKVTNAKHVITTIEELRKGVKEKQDTVSEATSNVEVMDDITGLDSISGLHKFKAVSKAISAFQVSKAIRPKNTLNARRQVDGNTRPPKLKTVAKVVSAFTHNTNSGVNLDGPIKRASNTESISFSEGTYEGSSKFTN